MCGEISRNVITMSGGTSKLTTMNIGGKPMWIDDYNYWRDKLSRGVTFDGLSTTYFLEVQECLIL